MGSDLDALLAAVLVEPECDTSRLVVADWYEEHGQAERAEFIRLDIGHDTATGRELTRAVELWEQFVLEWWRGAGPVRNRPHFRKGDYDHELQRGNPIISLVIRGFIAEVRGPLAVLRGGECPKCRGLIRVQMNGGGSMVAMDDPCPLCHGTGRTGGILRELVRREPVEVVEVVDKRAFENSRGGFSWFDSEFPEGEDDGHGLPDEIFNLLEGGNGVGAVRIGTREYPTESTARAALSRALLDEAKGPVPA